MSKPKVLVIVGPTSSGKTSLSIHLAKKFNGEIISADSRQVYKDLNIGTGKITVEEMEGVPHHLLNIINPAETYSVAEFVNDADEAVEAILKNKHLPIIAGGTFLYVDTLLGRISTPEVPPNETLRSDLESKNNEELFAMLLEKDPRRAKTIDKDNPRRLIRALEIIEAIGLVPEIIEEEKYDALILGIQISKDELKDNIHTRLESRLEDGMIDETVNLLEQGLSYERLEELGIEYKYVSKYLQGNTDMETMKQKIETKSWQYAKRQIMWLKRNKKIVWVKSNDFKNIAKITEDFLI